MKQISEVGGGSSPYRGVKARSRSGTFLFMIGAVAGCLVAGLLVPLVFGSRESEVSTTATTSGQASVGSGVTGQGGTSDSQVGGPGDNIERGVESAAQAATAGVPASGSNQSASTPVTSAGSRAPLTASDVGVTPGTILIGGVVQDVAGAGQVGFGAAAGLSPPQQRSAYESFVNAVNARGGINGRKVSATYYTVEIANPDTQRAACLSFTQDKKVFAVLSPPGFTNAARCVTVENKTPLILADSVGIPTEWVMQANGLLATLFPASQRMLSTFVDTLDGMNLLQQKTIGILADQTDAGRLGLNSALLPALKQRGYSPKYVARFNADASTAASQMPVEVQQMRNAGVDTIMIITSSLYATQFAQTADGQQYRPKYLVPDWGAAGDAGYENMPPSFDGVWVSAKTTTEYNAGRPDSPATARCRQIYESATGDRLTRQDNGSKLRMDFTLMFCDLVDVLARAAQAAGPGLTRSAFSNGLQSLGQFSLSFWGPGSFGPGKLEYSDKARPNAWNATCKCWTPIRDF